MRLAAIPGRPRPTHPVSLNSSSIGTVNGRHFHWFPVNPVFTRFYSPALTFGFVLDVSWTLSWLTQLGILGTNPSDSAPWVVPHSSPLSQGAMGGGGAADLLRGWPTEASGKVPPVMQEDQVPPSRDLLLAFDVDRNDLGSASGSPFPELSVGTLAVSASMDELGRRDDSRCISGGDVVNVTCVGSSSIFNPATLLFPLSDSGFFLFPLSSSSSSSLGVSTVAPSVPPSLPFFSPLSVVPLVLTVSASTPPLSLLLFLRDFLLLCPFPRGFLPLFLLFLLPLLLFHSLLLLTLLLLRCLLFLLISFFLVFCLFCLHFWGFRFVSGTCVRSIWGVSSGWSLVCTV